MGSLVLGAEFLCAGIGVWEIILREFTMYEVWFDKEAAVYSIVGMNNPHFL